jgi:hypothetical protein
MLLLAVALAQDAVAPGEIRSYSTPTSIGIEWDVRGDAGHDATCAVELRGPGEEWRKVLGLFRVDYFGWYAETKADRAYNMLAGSALFLKPGTVYEVRLTLADPDGGGETRTLPIATRARPALPAGGRTLHVLPGEGGGTGAKDDPFRGLAAAQAGARPGDVVLVGSGKYGAFLFRRSGEPGRPVAWVAPKGTIAVFDDVEVQASHCRLEGLTLLRGKKQANGLRGRGASVDVVVRRCTFTGFHYSILLGRECRDWTIEDNSIEGDVDPLSGSLSGEGVELNHTDGHVVAHNRISRVADGVSYPGRNCDIYGNEIADVSDDGLEPDYGYANNRMWDNRITNFTNAGLSFQPQYCGPWYVIRNQLVGRGQIFKFRVQDRVVLVNNTFVRWGTMAPYMHHALSGLSRNNLYINAGSGREAIWVATDTGERKYLLPPAWGADWRTDVDYDGFDWGDSPAPFVWEKGKAAYKDLESLSAALGIEKHGRRVRKEEIFEGWSLPRKPEPLQPPLLLLKEGSAAVDAGDAVPGLTDGFAGKAPDLGAHELGKPPAVYGPRD